MYHKGSSLESGIGSEDSRDTAVLNFFDFLNKLGSPIHSGRATEMDEILDPTIDLDEPDEARAMALPTSLMQHKNMQPPTDRRASEPVSNRQTALRKIVDKPKKAHETFDVVDKQDPSLSELEVIVAQLRAKSPYGEKLACIMLKNLEKTLSGDLYRILIEYGLPENWLPIVKMNNDNTPYVEFLIKSDISDQSPDDQISGYSGGYMSLCKFILDQIRAFGRKKLCPSANNQQLQKHQQPRIQNRTSKIQSQTFTNNNKNKQLEVAANHKENRASLPTPMACSTPKAQRRAPVKRNPTIEPKNIQEDSLNDSKRILPPRACKTSSIGLYKP